jgi:hypothetical protein
MSIVSQLELPLEQRAIVHGPFITRRQALQQGLTQYFTGRPCIRGHFSVRSTSCNQCRECHRLVYSKTPAAKEAAREYMRAKRAAMTEEEKRAFTASRSGYILDYINSRRQVDHGFRLRMNLRHRVWTALNGRAKAASTFDLIGCSVEELRGHLERQFLPGMTWDNYGKTGWEVDHIRPCASFDLTDPEQQRQCFHCTNLQPLWVTDNIRKGARF